MNKEELKYIKENYYAKPPSLDFLYEMIDEVMETESSKRLLREQMENSSLTMQVIPEISVSELVGPMSEQSAIKKCLAPPDSSYYSSYLIFRAGIYNLN